MSQRNPAARADRRTGRSPERPDDIDPRLSGPRREAAIRERVAADIPYASPDDIIVDEQGARVDPTVVQAEQDRRRRELREQTAAEVDFADPEDVIVEQAEGGLETRIDPGVVEAEREQRREELRQDVASEAEYATPEDVILGTEDGELQAEIDPDVVEEVRQQRRQELREQVAADIDYVEPADVVVETTEAGELQADIDPEVTEAQRAQQEQQLREQVASQYDFADPDDVVVSVSGGEMTARLQEEVVDTNREQARQQQREQLREDVASRVEWASENDVQITEEDGELTAGLPDKLVEEQRQQQRQDLREEVAGQADWLDASDVQVSEEDGQLVADVPEAVIAEQEDAIRQRQMQDVREELASRHENIEPEHVDVSVEDGQVVGEVDRETILEQTGTFDEIREQLASRSEYFEPRHLDVSLEDGSFDVDVVDTPQEIQTMLQTDPEQAQDIYEIVTDAPPTVDEAAADLREDIASEYDVIEPEHLSVEFTDSGYETTLETTPPELREMLTFDPERAQEIHEGVTQGFDITEVEQSVAEEIASRHEDIEPRHLDVTIEDEQVDVDLQTVPDELKDVVTGDPERAQDILGQFNTTLQIEDGRLEGDIPGEVEVPDWETFREQQPEQAEQIIEGYQEDLAAQYPQLDPGDFEVSVEDGQLVPSVSEDATVDQEIPTDAIREPRGIDPVEAIADARDIPEDVIQEAPQDDPALGVDPVEVIEEAQDVPDDVIQEAPQDDPALGDEYLEARLEMQEQEALRKEALESGIDDEDAYVAEQLDTQTDIVDITAQDVDVTGTRVEDGEEVLEYELSEDARTGLVAEENREAVIEQVEADSPVSDVDELSVEDGQLVANAEVYDPTQLTPATLDPNQPIVTDLDQQPDTPTVDTQVPVSIGETEEGEFVAQPDLGRDPAEQELFPELQQTLAEWDEALIEGVDDLSPFDTPWGDPLEGAAAALSPPGLARTVLRVGDTALDIADEPVEGSLRAINTGGELAQHALETAVEQPAQATGFAAGAYLGGRVATGTTRRVAGRAPDLNLADRIASSRIRAREAFDRVRGEPILREGPYTERSVRFERAQEAIEGQFGRIPERELTIDVRSPREIVSERATQLRTRWRDRQDPRPDPITEGIDLRDATQFEGIDAAGQVTVGRQPIARRLYERVHPLEPRVREGVTGETVIDTRSLPEAAFERFSTEVERGRMLNRQELGRLNPRSGRLVDVGEGARPGWALEELSPIGRVRQRVQQARTAAADRAIRPSEILEDTRGQAQLVPRVRRRGRTALERPSIDAARRTPRTVPIGAAPGTQPSVDMDAEPVVDPLEEELDALSPAIDRFDSNSRPVLDTTQRPQLDEERDVSQEQFDQLYQTPVDDAIDQTARSGFDDRLATAPDLDTYLEPREEYDEVASTPPTTETGPPQYETDARSRLRRFFGQAPIQSPFVGAGVDSGIRALTDTVPQYQQETQQRTRQQQRSRYRTERTGRSRLLPPDFFDDPTLHPGDAPLETGAINWEAAVADPDDLFEEWEAAVDDANPWGEA